MLDNARPPAKLSKKQPSPGKKRFTWSLRQDGGGAGRDKGKTRQVQLSDQLESRTDVAYMLPPAPPQPGIRVSSLGSELPTSRAGSGSLHRSLSLPASLRSRSIKEELEDVGKDFSVGSSRSPYYGFSLQAEPEVQPTQGSSCRSSTLDFVSCLDMDDTLVFEEEGFAVPLEGLGLDELPPLPGHFPTAPAPEDDLVLEGFDRLVRADAYLGAAIEDLVRCQRNIEESTARRIARRSSSLPSLPRVEATSAPSRSRWQAISAIMRPQPELPEEDLSLSEESEDEADPQTLIRLAIEDVRAAQAGLLASLSELAVILGLDPQRAYEQHILVSAQNLLADASYNVVSEDIQNLRSLAMRTCETLERVREISATLVQPRNTRVRVSAIAGAPVAPLRESSLASVKRTFVHRDTLLVTLQAWDIAYREFATSWQRHQQTARDARRLARQQLRSSRIITAAHSLGLDASVVTSEGLGTVIATAQLVSSTLERAIRDGLISRDEAVQLEPRVFFALPRLSILFGAREALLPSSWEQPTPSTVEEKKPERPLTLFLPRVCGSLSNETIRAVRSLSPIQLFHLARLLAGANTQNGRVTTRRSSLMEADGLVWKLYQEIAALADRESLGTQQWRKILSRCLKAWAAEQRSEQGH